MVVIIAPTRRSNHGCVGWRQRFTPNGIAVGTCRERRDSLAAVSRQTESGRQNQSATTRPLRPASARLRLRLAATTRPSTGRKPTSRPASVPPPANFASPCAVPCPTCDAAAGRDRDVRAYGRGGDRGVSFLRPWQSDGVVSDGPSVDVDTSRFRLAPTARPLTPNAHLVYTRWRESAAPETCLLGHGAKRTIGPGPSRSQPRRARYLAA